MHARGRLPMDAPHAAPAPGQLIGYVLERALATLQEALLLLLCGLGLAALFLGAEKSFLADAVEFFRESKSSVMLLLHSGDQSSV